MPHPKRRQSRHRQGIRRSHLALKPYQPNHCPRCSEPIKTHRVCDNCGHYGFEKKGEKGTAVLPPREDDI